MSISGSSTRIGSAVAAAAAVGSKAAPVQPVQAVTSDRPAPDRRFDASGRGSSSSGALAALVLQRGGTPAPLGAAPAAAGATAAVDAAAPAIKPNLDALNRVLAHYVAQTAAAARLRT